MVSSGVAVVAYAAVSTLGLLCQLDGPLTELVAAGASTPLRTALHRASRGELSSEAAQAARALLVSHFLKDTVSSLVVLNFALSMYTLSAFLMKAMFLGPLTALEAEKLAERMLKWLMLKLVFIAAVTGPGLPETAAWVSWFAVVGCLKMFVGLARDRAHTLLHSPSATLLAHARTLALLLLLFCNDCAWIAATLRQRDGGPLSQRMLWLFDAVVAALEAAAILVKYCVLVAEQLRERQRLRWGGNSDGDLLYKVEVATDLAVRGLTLSHLTHVWWLHGCAFHLVDAILFLDIRHLFCSICHGCRRFRKYRSATHNLNHCFPDAAPSELAGGECVICREGMQSAKLLPCGHVFHLRCLTAWLQQSGGDNFTCPLCRLPLFAASAAAAPGAGREAEDEPGAGQLEHDVEVETFSSQVVGQALAEAARQLAEGGHTLLRQNWAAELRRLEHMVQGLRARLLEGAAAAPASGARVGGSSPERALSGAGAGGLSPAQSASLVAELERQLGDIRCLAARPEADGRGRSAGGSSSSASSGHAGSGRGEAAEASGCCGACQDQGSAAASLEGSQGLPGPARQHSSCCVGSCQPHGDGAASPGGWARG